LSFSQAPEPQGLGTSHPAESLSLGITTQAERPNE
jgi:hypothetical protein